MRITSISLLISEELLVGATTDLSIALTTGIVKAELGLLGRLA
jgi:hypothetical protein